MPIKTPKEKITVLVIFTAALLLRLGYTFFLRKNYFFYAFPSTDVLFYQDWAKDILSRGPLSHAVFFGMPLYPYFLAILNRLFHHLELVRVIHLILGSVNAVFVYLIAKKIFSEATARLASILTAMNFILIYYDWLMMPVTLIIFLSCVIVYGLLCLNKTSPLKEWLYLGIIIGTASLADGKFIIFIFLYLLAAAFYNRRQFNRRIVKIGGVVLFGFILPILIVTIRNTLIGKDVIFISGHSGINFYIGNNEKADGTFKNPMFLRPYHQGHIDDPRIIAEATLKKRLSPREVSRFWRNKAFAFIKSEPDKYLRLLLKKAQLFFIESQATQDMDLLFQREAKRRLDVNGFRLVMPLALLGILLSWRRKKQGGVLVLLAASQFIFTLLFFLINRHRVTVLPFLIIFESYAFVSLADWIKSREIQKECVALAGTGLLFLLFRPQTLDDKVLEFHKLSKAGPIYAEKGLIAQARAQYLLALELQPFDTSTLYNLANLLLQTGDYQEAVYYYEKALSINPLDVDVAYNLAFTYEAAGNIPKAISLYRKVLSLSPGSLDAHMRLAKIWQAKGDCPKAIAHYNAIKSYAPRYSQEIDKLIATCPQAL